MRSGLIETDFCVIDTETAGGTWATFPSSFELLFTGLRHGDFQAIYSGSSESLDTLLNDLADFDGPVVTFNGSGFDLPLLDHWANRILARPLEINLHYDLLDQITRASGHRISLDRVCRYTFGEGKMDWDHRENAKVWTSEPAKLVAYNLVDLDLTHKLFLRVLQGLPLFLGDATVVLPQP